jgi:CheY-like chemotaxis protein
MTWLQRLHGGFNVLPAWAVDSALAAVVAVVELSLLSLDPAQFDQAAIGYEGPTAAAVVCSSPPPRRGHCPWPCAAPTRARRWRSSPSHSASRGTSGSRPAGSASSCEVVVCLAYGEHEVDLEVLDDGCGPDGAAVPVLRPAVTGWWACASGPRSSAARWRSGRDPEAAFRVAVNLTLETLGARVTLRLLLVDEQALMRAGFRMILEAEDDLQVVGEAADGAQAVELAARLRPDIVLMGVRMPRMDGLEATRRLAGPNAPSRSGS